MCTLYYYDGYTGHIKVDSDNVDSLSCQFTCAYETLKLNVLYQRKLLFYKNFYLTVEASQKNSETSLFREESFGVLCSTEESTKL